MRTHPGSKGGNGHRHCHELWLYSGFEPLEPLPWCGVRGDGIFGKARCDWSEALYRQAHHAGVF